MLCPYSLSRSLKFDAFRTQQNKSATYMAWIGLEKKRRMSQARPTSSGIKLSCSTTSAACQAAVKYL